MTIDWDAIWQTLDWGSGDSAEDVEHTLLQRAENYARTVELDEQADSDIMRALVFTRGQERYAVPASFVIQGLTLHRITPLPCVPPHYRGVINLRGRIVSVLDIRRFWGLPAEDTSDVPRLIVVRVANFEIALLADDVLELASIPLHEIAPPVTAGIGLDHVQGVSPRGIVIIDVESLSADRRLKVHEELL